MRSRVKGRVFISVYFWVLGMLGLVVVLVGLSSVFYMTTPGEIILYVLVMLFGVAMPFIDLWAQVVVVGRDSVTYGVPGTLRAHRRTTPYAAISAVEILPSSRLIGSVIAIATDERTDVAEAIFLTKASANRARDTIARRAPSKE